MTGFELCRKHPAVLPPVSFMEIASEGLSLQQTEQTIATHLTSKTAGSFCEPREEAALSAPCFGIGAASQEGSSTLHEVKCICSNLSICPKDTKATNATDEKQKRLKESLKHRPESISY